MTNTLNILVVGSGAREHALATKISESPRCATLHVAPGNAGTPGTRHHVAATDVSGIVSLCHTNHISLVVVGPEAPLAAGLVDALLAAGVAAFGPSQALARLESDKSYARAIAHSLNLPGPRYAAFAQGETNAALQWWKDFGANIVVKQSGLAGGKGVVVPNSAQETAEAIREALLVGDVVLEERLIGTECSMIAMSDGKTSVAFPLAQDHKRIGEGDTGLNTGGMGAISPVPFADAILLEKIETRIVKPTIEGFQKDGIEYKGFVFIGLIIVKGEPIVIEYNVRMGDPETEVVIPRLKSDLVELFQAVADEKLDEVTLEIDERSATTIMVVSGGYPEDYEKGKVILGIEKVADSIVFHAGTKLENGQVVSNGGRVLAVTSFGENFQEAIKKSYQNIDKLHFDKMYFRKDIGKDLDNS